MRNQWRRVREDPRLLKLVLSYVGVGLALAAVIVDRPWLTWAAIVTLSGAVILRLHLARRRRMAAEATEREEATED